MVGSLLGDGLVLTFSDPNNVRGFRVCLLVSSSAISSLNYPIPDFGYSVSPYQVIYPLSTCWRFVVCWDGVGNDFDFSLFLFLQIYRMLVWRSLWMRSTGAPTCRCWWFRWKMGRSACSRLREWKTTQLSHIPMQMIPLKISCTHWAHSTHSLHSAVSSLWYACCFVCTLILSYFDLKILI